jgi:hypothetical protein
LRKVLVAEHSQRLQLSVVAAASQEVPAPKVVDQVVVRNPPLHQIQ